MNLVHGDQVKSAAAVAALRVERVRASAHVENAVRDADRAAESSADDPLSCDRDFVVHTF